MAKYIFKTTNEFFGGTFSRFNSHLNTEPSKGTNLSEIIQEITSTQHKQLCDQIRNEPSKEKQRYLKANLPAVAFSGEFKQRNKNGLIKHSGYVCLDFDLADNPRINREAMRKDRHTLACFDSPSGGLKVVVEVDHSDHSAAYKAAREYYETKHFLKADESGSDVSRLCYLSHDPAAHFNYNAHPIQVPTKKPEPAREIERGEFTVEKVDSMLAAIRSKVSRPDYDVWLKIIFSTSDAIGEWNAHSLLVKHFPEETEGEYQEKMKHPLSEVTAETLVHLAQDAGWHPERGEVKKVSEAVSSEEDIFEPIAELWAQEIEFAKPAVGRFGGRAIFYEETTNYIFGTRACGKSWLALYVAAEGIADGRHVVYIDPESSAKRILWRLKYLGVDPEQGAKCFHYIASTDPQKIRKVQQWAKQKEVMVIYDGLANAIAGAGKEENSSAALEILQAQVKPFADNGGTVIVIDHTGKDETKGARGHSSKEAFFKGACYHVKTGTAFSRGTGGFLKLELAKDNEGGTECVQGQVLAVFEATISENGKTLFKLREPSEVDRGSSSGRSVKMTDEEILKALPFGQHRAMKYENISPALNVRTFAERCEKIEGAHVKLMPSASGQQAKHFWREIEIGKVEGEK